MGSNTVFCEMSMSPNWLWNEFILVCSPIMRPLFITIETPNCYYLKNSEVWSKPSSWRASEMPDALAPVSQLLWTRKERDCVQSNFLLIAGTEFKGGHCNALWWWYVLILLDLKKSRCSHTSKLTQSAFRQIWSIVIKQLNAPPTSNNSTANYWLRSLN